MGTFDSGTKTTGVHTMLIKGDGYYNQHGYRCYIFAGTNIGNEREIIGWVKDTHTLTFSPAFGSAIGSTSQFELHDKFTESEYRMAINLSIENLAGKYLVDLIDDTTITLEADTYEYALPLSMIYLYRVITEDKAGSDEFFESGVVDPRDYSIMKAYPPTLKLYKGYYSIVAGKDLRLEGQGTQPIVSADTDVINLPPDWVVQKAITFLPQAKILSNNLDNIYKQALALSAKEPRNWPDPRAKRIVE